MKENRMSEANLTTGGSMSKDVYHLFIDEVKGLSVGTNWTVEQTMDELAMALRRAQNTFDANRDAEFARVTQERDESLARIEGAASYLNDVMAHSGLCRKEGGSGRGCHVCGLLSILTDREGDTE